MQKKLNISAFDCEHFTEYFLKYSLIFNAKTILPFREISLHRAQRLILQPSTLVLSCSYCLSVHTSTCFSQNQRLQVNIPRVPHRTVEALQVLHRESKAGEWFERTRRPKWGHSVTVEEEIKRCESPSDELCASFFGSVINIWKVGEIREIFRKVVRKCDSDRFETLETRNFELINSNCCKYER